MRLSTTAFRDGARIPGRHTKDGADVSPALVVEDLPPETASLALVVDDPDAPGRTWVHWLIWGIPADRVAVPEDVPPEPEVTLLGGARQGRNDFGELGYGGPRPPRGHGPHRYRFTVYALREFPSLEPGSGRAELEAAMAGLTVASARLTGTYER